MRLYHGELLEGLSLNERPFEDWLVAEREKCRVLAARALKQLADMLEQNHQWDEAIVQTTALLALEPFEEDTHRSLMRLYMAQGRFDAALRQFEQCKGVLRRKLDVAPEPETTELWHLARTKRGRVELTSGETTIQRAQTSRMVLLACSHLSVDERSEVSRLSELIESRGGRLISVQDGGILAAFSDPSQTMLAAMEIRQKKNGPDLSLQSDLRIGLHVAEHPETRSGIDERDRALVRRVESYADPGQIDVSAPFFHFARRESPCYFDDLGEDSRQATRSRVHVYRVTKPIARHPFQASYANQSPRSEKRANSIAVAPIKVVGAGADDQEFLSEGLTEDLILELSRIKRLSVSSRTTLVAIGSHDAIEVGEALGVKYVLSGSVRMIGRDIRLNISLAETEWGRIVWSDRLRYTLDNFFDLFDTVVAQVAATVSGRIEQAEISVARLKRPANMTAYEYYLRGVWHHRMGGVTSSHSRQAVDWFRRSIQADPGFGRPRSLLVCAWSDLPDYDYELGVKCAAEALELDPTDPEAHRILGWSKIVQGDFDAGKRHYERAVALAPNDAYILGRSAALHSFNGEPEKALELLGRAEALDPFLPVYVVEERVVANYGLEEYQRVLREARSLPFQTRRSQYYSAAALAALNQLDAAKQAITTALVNDPSLSSEYVLGQEIYRDHGQLERLLERLHSAGLPDIPGQQDAPKKQTSRDDTVEASLSGGS